MFCFFFAGWIGMRGGDYDRHFGGGIQVTREKMLSFDGFCWCWGWLMYMYHIMRLPSYISTLELSNLTFDLCFIFT